ncbi:hypothetical protein CCP3SC1AL1_470003 [Gammaproteobacteria bacterium]
MYCGRMKTASDIITFLGGRQAVADLVSVKIDAVRKAEDGNKLPAAWYNMLENRAGRPLPRDCFTFKGAA